MKVAQTKRVPAGELKVGDTLIIPVYQGVEAYGAPAVILETITGIEPVGDYGGLKFTTKWQTEDSGGESEYHYNKLSFVTKL